MMMMMIIIIIIIIIIILLRPSREQYIFGGSRTSYLLENYDQHFADINHVPLSKPVRYNYTIQPLNSIKLFDA